MPGSKAIEADKGSEVIPFDTELLVPHEIVPVRELKPLLPILTWKDAENGRSYDFGQNLAGYVAFTVEAKPGARVIIEHSEIVDRDQEFDNRNYRTAEARIEYILKGGGKESYRPLFHIPGLPLCARDGGGKGGDHVDRLGADQLGIGSRRRASCVATPW